MAIRKVGYIRPTWAETWMEIVGAMAKRSVCRFHQVAFVAVDRENKNPLVVGYNGPASGEPHCCDVGVDCSKLDENGKMKPPGSGECVGGHAEMNGTGFAAKIGLAIGGAIIYCTYSPCWDCAKHLTRLDIIKFIYKERYETDFEKVEKLFQRHRIELVQYDV